MEVIKEWSFKNMLGEVPPTNHIWVCVAAETTKKKQQVHVNNHADLKFLCQTCPNGQRNHAHFELQVGFNPPKT